MQQQTVDVLAAALVDCVDDRDETVRRNAVELLGELGPSSAQPVLLRLIDSDDRALRSWAAIGLKKLAHCGPEMLQPLLAALQNEEWSVRLNACEALYRLETVHEIRVTDLLRALAGLRDRSRDVAVSETAAWLLERNGKASLPELIQGLDSDSFAVRLACLKALYYLKCSDEHAIDRIRGLLQDRETIAVRAWATMALANAHSSGATLDEWVPSLVDVLLIPWADYLSPEVKRAALHLLARVGEAAVDAVPTVLDVRKQFGGTAWDVPVEAFGSKAIPHVRVALAAGTISDYEAVVWLAKLGDPDALGLADEIVAKGTYAHSVAECYGVMGDAGLIRARQLLEDPSRTGIHDAVVTGLSHAGPDGLTLISEALRSGSQQARSAAAHVAAWERLAELKPQLIDAMRCEYDYVRIASACALVHLGHAEGARELLLKEWTRDASLVVIALLETRAAVPELVPLALARLSEPENCTPSLVRVLGLLATTVGADEKQQVIEMLRDLSGLWDPLRKEALTTASKLQRRDVEVPFPTILFGA